MKRNCHINMPLFITALFFFALLTSPFSPAEAASPMSKLSEIQNAIMNKLEKVREAKVKEKSIVNKIGSIDEDITKKEKELKRYDKRIFKSKKHIKNLSKEIRSLDSKLEQRTTSLNERIRAIHKRQYGSSALLLISAADYQDLIRKSKYVSLLAHYDSTVIRKYSTDIKEINTKKMELENSHKKLKKSKHTIGKKKSELETNRAEKDKLLAMVKSRRLAQENKLKELKESSRRLQNMVKKLKRTSIPESILGQGFKASIGNLPWPVKGKILIPYGNYKDPGLNTTVFKTGMEIAAGRGAKPQAIAGGRVVYASTFERYGNLLIIDHGSGYHSLYGNLSEVSLKRGELLIPGMDVGKVSRSKTLDVPALYFEIRYKGKPVDPATWLAKKG